MSNETAPTAYGYICKECGGPAPMGIGYSSDAPGAAAASQHLTACACGYSETPAPAPTAAERDALRRQRQAMHAAVTPPAPRFTIWHGPKSKAKGRRVTVWTPEQLAETIPENGAAVVYASFGHVSGTEGFARTVLVRDGAGVTAVDKHGNVSYGLPAAQGRTARILVK